MSTRNLSPDWYTLHRYLPYMVDCLYTASTCDVMSCRQRRHLYYGGCTLTALVRT
jgi:hypothetical protein